MSCVTAGLCRSPCMKMSSSPLGSWECSCKWWNASEKTKAFRIEAKHKRKTHKGIPQTQKTQKPQKRWPNLFALFLPKLCMRNSPFSDAPDFWLFKPFRLASNSTLSCFSFLLRRTMTSTADSVGNQHHPEILHQLPPNITTKKQWVADNNRKLWQDFPGSGSLMNWNLSGLLLLAEDKFDSGVLDIVRAGDGTDFWWRREPVTWLRFKLVLSKA